MHKCGCATACVASLRRRHSTATRRPSSSRRHSLSLRISACTEYGAGSSIVHRLALPSFFLSFKRLHLPLRHASYIMVSEEHRIKTPTLGPFTTSLSRPVFFSTYTHALAISTRPSESLILNLSTRREATRRRATPHRLRFYIYREM